MESRVLLERRDDILVVRVDNPPVNALSPGVPEAIARAVRDAADDVRAIVFGATGRTFVAGADIAALEQAAWSDPAAAIDLHDLLETIERSPAPVVMAIHGTALGGGLELAMAGHYRVARADAQLGQPEVNLGIIPGAEGTQRLPRLVGVGKALDLCVSGRPIRAADALECGLVDALISPDEDLITAAIAFARERIANGPRPRRTSERLEKLGTPAANAPLFEAARATAGRIRRHQIAPLKAIEAIRAATELGYLEGCRRERELFFECIAGSQAKAMIHVFFAERAAARVPGLGKDTTALPLARVGIVGAGTMGTGIAIASANAGLEVVLKDVTADRLEQGLASIRQSYASSITRGRLTQAAVDERLARIRSGTTYDGFETVDVVIEAAVEQLDLKCRIFHELEAVTRADCLLGSNTSTLSVDAIAQATTRQGAVVGLHFFSPANVMRLVEIVRGASTSPETLATAIALAKRLGKVGVVVGNCPGFVGNRLMFPYMYESHFIVEEGATPSQVDHALTTFGMAMGMFAVDDMAGIDVAWHAKRAMGHVTDAAERRPSLQDRLFEMGRLGQKTGKGWYTYDSARTPTADPEVERLIRTLAVDAGIPQRAISDQEIIERMIYALINEGARVVDEGFALRASDIDVIYVNGYGFPSWRGGPMLYADLVGLDVVLDRVREFHDRWGPRWAPAPLLERLAAAGRTFREYDRERHG